jgi:hypothetical protein
MAWNMVGRQADDQDRIASDGGLGWFNGHWTSWKSSDNRS